MARHRRFTDGAGYTRHCWECVHAKGWRLEKGTYDMNHADCELTGRVVNKYDSPNNQCCHLPVGCEYETEEDK